MKTLPGTGLATLAGLVMMSSAMAGSPVVRVMVGDADGQARAACGALPTGGSFILRWCRKSRGRANPSNTCRPIPSAYCPEFPPGFGVLRPDLGNGSVVLPGRLCDPVSNGYPRSYRPTGNYGVDSILYNGNRGKFGIPGNGRPAGAFPRAVVRP